MNSVFCPLTHVISNGTYTWNINRVTSADPKPCIHGRSTQEFAFEYIRNIFDAHEGIPKFIYLNALAARDYSLDAAYQALELESYDHHLSIFLQEFLSGKEAENTIIILRSHHGIERGEIHRIMIFLIGQNRYNKYFFLHRSSSCGFQVSSRIKLHKCITFP